MPLVRHTDEMFNTRRPNGDITTDIFGPTNHVEAVEADFRLTATLEPPVGDHRL